MSRLLVSVLAAAGLLLPAAPDPNPDLLRVRNVYVMSMARGLDQYLANRIVREGKYQVVTDPQLADAVLTDRLGPDFEQRFEEMYAPTEPVTAEPKEKDSSSSLNTALAWGDAGPRRTSSFSSAAGNLFLVDRGTKVVLWSSYKRTKRSTPEELYRTSDWHIERLHTERRRAEKEFPSGPVAPQPPVSAPAAQPDPPPPPAEVPPAPPSPAASPAPPSDSSPPAAK